MLQEGINKPLTGQSMLPLFGRSCPTSESIHVVGPNWMDDLAICIDAPHSATLVSQMGLVAGFLLDTCEYHCMTPNLKPGKTEIMFDFRGPQKRHFVTQYYGPGASQSLPVVCEHATKRIQLISRYKHLAGIAHHTSDHAPEIRHRVAIAHETINHHRKVLFQNKHIAITKRAELFNMLVLSKLLYGCESWLVSNEKSQKNFHTSVMRLYRRLACVRGDHHMTDDDILERVHLPEPAVLLRLRYLALLEHSGLTDLWAILNGDKSWLALIENDLTWMWKQLSNASDLPDPRIGYEKWLYLIQTSPNYWKRLVRRACEHSIGQRLRTYQVERFYRQAMQQLASLTALRPDLELERTPEIVVYGCMQCSRPFRTRAGEAAHMCKVHGEVAPVRFLFDQPTCGACLRHYHTMQKMKAHLHYSSRCRAIRLSRNTHCDPVPGSGSRQDQDLVRTHDRLLPPLPGEGPHPAPQRFRDAANIDDELHIYMVDTLAEGHDILELETLWRSFCETHPISWTLWRRTLLFFKDTLVPEDAYLLNIDFKQLLALLDALCAPASWPFFSGGSRSLPSAQDRKPTVSAQDDCAFYSAAFEEGHVLPVPRVFGRFHLVLHAFSGRRRIGDLQYYLDLLAKQQTDFTLQVISLDVINDPVLGDAMNQKTCEFWWTAIRQKHVIAFLGGPPCESWSIARGQAVEAHHESRFQGPRIVRTAASLWGLDSLRLRELAQVLTGNALLQFSILCIIELILVDGFALMEHPAEPQHAPEAASVWRLPIIKVLASLPNVQILTFCQGLMGSSSPKPTGLLTVNLPELLSTLHAHRVRVDLPRVANIGKDQ